MIFFPLTSSFLMVALNPAQQRRHRPKFKHCITQTVAVPTGLSFPPENWIPKSYIMPDFEKNLIASEYWMQCMDNWFFFCIGIWKVECTDLGIMSSLCNVFLYFKIFQTAINQVSAKYFLYLPFSAVKKYILSSKLISLFSQASVLTWKWTWLLSFLDSISPLWRDTCQ